MQLKGLIRSHNREKMIEALIAIGVGLASCVVIFAIVFWLSWLGAWMLQSIHDFRPLHVAMGVTGLFFIVSLWTAWRSIDPVDHVDLRLAPGEQSMRILEWRRGFQAGVPIIRRETIAWSGSILVAGPANLLDGLRAWKERLPTDPETVAAAMRVLDLAGRGETLDADVDERAAALLGRLGLLRVDLGEGGALRLNLTEKGRKAAASA